MMICDDVLIDVCRFLDRKQLANSISELNRRCCQWFQPGQVYHRHPTHWVETLDVQIELDQRDELSFSISFWSKMHEKRIDLLASKSWYEDDDDDGHQQHSFRLPDYMRFKTVRMKLDAMLTADEHDQSILRRLHGQRVDLINRLLDHFYGATLIFVYYLLPSKSAPKNRRWFSMLLSDQFFADLFAKFETIQFVGDPLPIEALPLEQHRWESPEKFVEEQALLIEQHPLLLLPGLIDGCQKLMFKCTSGDQLDATMLGVKEIVAWLHQPFNNKERFLCIKGILFMNWSHAVHWMHNLTSQLVKCLLNASHAQFYRLYICGPMFDLTEEEQLREDVAIFKPGMMARNDSTKEELVHSIYRGEWHTDPLGLPVYYTTSKRAEPLGVFQRRTTTHC